MPNIPCPKCAGIISVRTIFSESEYSWPELSWLYFKCQKCSQYSHFLVERIQISPIKILSGQGLEWDVIASFPIANFSTRSDPGYLHIWLENEHFEVVAKQ